MQLIPTALLSAACFATLTSAAIAGDQPYTIVDLGNLGGGEAAAYGLNDNGDVVGWSLIPNCFTATGAPCRRAFLWKDGVMTDLGKLTADEESFARAINNAGQIVGTSEADIIAGSGTFHGVTWNSGAISALPDLGDGQSFAHDINEGGKIAGHAVDPVTGRDSAMYWSGGSLFNIGSTETHSFNRAMGLNDSTAMVGFAWNLFQPNDSIAFSNGAWSTIGGVDSPWQNSEGRDVNNNGLVVGYQAFPSGDWHGAYWEPGAKGATDIGLLAGHEVSELYDVNEAGVAVGRSYAFGPPFVSSAVMFDGKQLVDLNDLVPAGFAGTLYEGREINENGAIAGTAQVNGLFHAFLMEPTPSWTELNGELGGAKGAPILTGYGSLEGGTPGELQITSAPPAAPAVIVVGASQANLPVLGGLLVPNPDFLFTPLTTDFAGEVEVHFTWPTGIPAGIPLYFQAWVQDATGPFGFTASRAVTQSSH